MCGSPRHGKPLSEASHIHPSTDPHGGAPPEVLEKKSDIYYRLRGLHGSKFVDKRGEVHEYKRGEFAIEIMLCLLGWRQADNFADKPFVWL